MKFRLTALIIIIALAFSCNSDKTSAGSHEDSKNAESSIEGITRNANKNLYWGDTHLHTANSPDAFAFGARLTPDDAYRFAKGETIESEGMQVQLDRPLDFLVVADHAEGFGLIQELIDENPVLMRNQLYKKWSKQLQLGGDEASAAGRDIINRFAAGEITTSALGRKVSNRIVSRIWEEYLTIAEQHYDPGTFTSLMGYEWSALPQGNNLHRNVIYRDGIEKVKRMIPISSTLSNDPEDLWKGLEKYEKKTGGKVLAIPHNGNVSNGLMFTLTDFQGNPMTKEYAKLRSRWEPLVETTQIKGDSESHPFLSPNDEFANYGDDGWDIGNLTVALLKKPEMLQYEYSREALKNGLLIEEELGVNPFDFGMIGSTDSHTALATADSDNYTGKFTSMVNNPRRADHSELIVGGNDNDTQPVRHKWQYLASGYAAVWAESNTREDLWDAMQRKEVYGTTGPRIQLRFFGGWDFQEEDVQSADYVSTGYSKGVPMGSDILEDNSDKSPSFIIAASKDAEGANLDRVQIIKGWVKEGKTFEKIYNVAWSDNRELLDEGKLSAVVNTVNIDDATYENSIGSEELITVWSDPDFDSDIRAFYYVRVLEIPTPRWTTYDAAKYDIQLSKEVPRTVQERAYSSPIWYSPK